MVVKLRRAEPEDARGAARVNVEAWRAAYDGIAPREVLDGLDVDERTAAYERAFTPPLGERGTWVAVEDGRVVGFASFGPCRDDDALGSAGEVYALYVLPEHWGVGVGGRLLRRALSDLADVGREPVHVWVLSDNPRARRFYEREGFELDAANERVAKTARGAELDHARYVRARAR